MTLVPTRSKGIYQASGTSIAATFTESSPLDSTYLLVAIVQVASTTAVTTPSGWTLLPNNGNNGTNQIRAYVRQGDGSVNSITVTIPSAAATLYLMAYPGY